MKYRELIESLNRNAIIYVHTAAGDRLGAYLKAHEMCAVPSEPVVIVNNKEDDSVDVYIGPIKYHYNLDNEVDENVLKRLVGIATVAYDDLGFVIYVPCEKFRD